MSQAMTNFYNDLRELVGEDKVQDVLDLFQSTVQWRLLELQEKGVKNAVEVQKYYKKAVDTQHHDLMKILHLLELQVIENRERENRNNPASK